MLPIDFYNYKSSQPLQKILLREISSIKKVEPVRTLLDIGAATGGLTKGFKKLGLNVSVFDLSKKNISKAFSTVKADYYFCGNIINFPGVLKYDIVIFSNIMGYFNYSDILAAISCLEFSHLFFNVIPIKGNEQHFKKEKIRVGGNIFEGLSETALERLCEIEGTVTTTKYFDFKQELLFHVSR